jgi:hypothetical protein
MEYPNRGTLWMNKYKKKELQPDMTGDIKIELDLLRDFLDSAESDHAVIKLDAWVSKDKDGNRKVSLKVNTYVKGEPVEQKSAKDPWDD